ILRLRQILELDPKNRLGWHAYASEQIERLQRRIAGEYYPGQAEERDALIDRLIAEAQTFREANDIDSLGRAITNWAEVRRLAPNNYSERAEEEIQRLQQQIEHLRAQHERRVAESARKENMPWIL